MNFKIAVIGECMVELQEIEPGNVRQTFGGDTLNAAIYMARLQKFFPLQIEYITALGTDPLSNKMIQFWENEGVKSNLVIQKPDEKPGLYFIQLDEHGERFFSYWRKEAAARKCFDFLESKNILDALEQYQAIYISGITLAILTQEGRNRLLDRLTKLHQQKISINFDYNYRPNLWKSPQEYKDTLSNLLPLIDIAFSGLDELEMLHGTSSLCKGHKFLLDSGVKESVIRNGNDPCSIQNKTSQHTIPIPSSIKIVDTTAAGDSFSGMYLVARKNGMEIDKAAALAHEMAGYVIQHKGAIAPKAYMPQFDI